MKRALPIAAVLIALLFAMAPADSAPSKPHALPADAQTPVIILDRNGGMILRKNQQPVFEVLADGTAIVGDPFGWGREVKGKLSPEELQDLLHFALDDKKFDDINSNDLQWPPGGHVSDATTTTIRINADGTDHTCKVVALEMLAALPGADKAAARLEAIDQRIQLAANTVALGGDDAVKKLVELVNAKLKTDLPGEPPITAADLAQARPHADAGADSTFKRKTILPDGKWHLTEATVSDDGHGKTEVRVAKGADQPAEQKG